MNEVDKKELRRLAEVIVSKGPRQDECTRVMTVEPSAILSLLDELDEKDRAIDLWSQKAQRISDELEQYRKDAERYRWLREQEAEQGLAVLHVSGWERAATCWATTYPDAELLDAAIDAAMVKDRAQ